MLYPLTENTTLRMSRPQGSFAGRFTQKWLLEECSMSLDRVAQSGKPQALMAAGALAGLSGAFSASAVCSP